MNKYDALLSRIAKKYQIRKGKLETDDEYKIRIIYSVCGMMAYASLWDGYDEKTISLIHMKKKIFDVLICYKEMYPEISNEISCISGELEKEIENIFLNTGVVYKRPNRVTASIKHETIVNNICFQRGISIDNISCVSGIGFYSILNSVASSGNIYSMFGLEKENLTSLWHSIISSAVWHSEIDLKMDIEFLRMKPPFYKGYWIDIPEVTGIVSILRVGMKGAKLYYLYRYVDPQYIEVSCLPQWLVESRNYLTLANACLSANGVLPKIEYFADESIVQVRMKYLLPPKELAFLKLYSWPETCKFFPCDYNRKITYEVFKIMQYILSNEGYKFTEV